MKKKWIIKGDTVKVIAGNDKGLSGEVMASKKDKILVKGVNVRKKHMKRQSQEMQSEIVSIERPIHISNVAICDSEGNKLKLSLDVTKEGDRNLVYDKGGNKEVYRSLKKVSK